MPLRDLQDKDGNHFTVMDVDGFYLPNFNFEGHENAVRSMTEWQARDDDILIVNYSKAGTHWIWEIIQMLYKQKAEFLTIIKETTMMAALTEERFDSLPSPRVLNTHIYFQNLPKDFFKRKCKIIYTVRNPKDTAVSYYHHHYGLLPYTYNGSWESYLPRFLAGDVDYMSWFDYVHQAQTFFDENKDYPIHIVQYEDMHLMTDFLDIKCSETLIKEISEKCKFDEMKRGKAHLGDRWKGNISGMYREGKVGGWKNVFTVAQNELFDKVYKEKMADLNLDLKYTL